jgi:curved DNA-binding protein
MDLPLAPWEAVLGASVDVPTPGGHVTLKIPPGTQAGQKLRLAGRGLARADGTSGHLYAVAKIMVPTVVDDHAKKLYGELKDASGFNPRAHMV